MLEWRIWLHTRGHCYGPHTCGKVMFSLCNSVHRVPPASGGDSLHQAGGLPTSGMGPPTSGTTSGGDPLQQAPHLVGTSYIRHHIRQGASYIRHHIRWGPPTTGTTSGREPLTSGTTLGGGPLHQAPH